MKSFRNGGSFKMIDLKGVKSGMLTALFPVRQDKWGCYFWLCKCDCGKECEVSGTRINKGETKSCGCLKLKKGQNEKHGLKKHPLYSVWAGMKYRCYNVKSHNYPLYGGRGIIVCDRWLQSIVNFYEDMIDGYAKGLHLDRINNDGNYEPTNCRWLTHTQNSNNKRNNVYICMDGRTHTPAEWGRELNIKDNTIANRKRKGWVDYDTLFGLK